MMIRRAVLLIVVGVICPLLLSGCASMKASALPGFTLEPGALVTVEPPKNDSLGLAALASRELERMGMRVTTGADASPQAVLRLEAGTAPDLTPEGVRTESLQRLRLLLVDPATGGLLSSADYVTGQSPLPASEVMAALLAKMQGAWGKEVPSGGVVPLAQPAPFAPVAVPPSPSSEDPAPVAVDAATPPPSDKEDQEGNPWVPRLESWGFEKWGSGEGGIEE